MADVMDKSRFKIGWYCPFSFPLLQRNFSKYLQQFHWHQHNSFIKNNDQRYIPIKLCDKLTTLDALFNAEIYDGIVMVDCCNMSYLFYEYVSRIDNGTSVHLMQMPRKESIFFSDIIVGEQYRLKAWINNLKRTARGKEVVSEGENVLNGPEEPSNSCFCKLPDEYAIQYQNSNVIAVMRDLMKKVNCPRMLKEQNATNICDLEHAADKMCINQQYYIVSMISHNRRIDQYNE